MSAVAIPFDPSMGLGARPAFTWPAGPLESAPSHDTFGAEFASMPHPASDPSLTPPSIASSLTSSPPRSTFTAEQREMKRQQDRARRDSRLASRLRRVSSQTSYLESSPMSIPDVTNSMELPGAYTTATAPMSLLTEPAGPMASPSYMSSYTPPLPEINQAAPMFPTPYGQSMPQNYGMALDYQPSPYASSSAYSRSPSLSVGHQDAPMMYQVPPVMASGGAPASASPEGGHVRVVQSRPKPRCWEHGCNGRQFSTFSNLLRHQREKSGQAAKATCPNCGAEFTRTTARNGHLLHDKCKQRRSS